MNIQQQQYKRDLEGYSNNQPKGFFPNGSKLAISFVINFEEGGENNILHNDQGSEWLLSDITGEKSRIGQRNLNIETLYEYGSRVGYWRLHHLFYNKYQYPVTIYAVGMALERNPKICKSLKNTLPLWEIASHGYRWIDYCNMDEETELLHLKKTFDIHSQIFNEKPRGIYQGKPSINTRRLALLAGFEYDNDSYNDEVPYYNKIYKNKDSIEEIKVKNGWLTLPYTLECNDMRFNVPPGFTLASQFLEYLIDSYETLKEETNETGSLRMMTIGLHCRIIPRAGRIKALKEFLKYIQKDHQDNKIWIAKRCDIHDFWKKQFPYQ